VAGELDEDVSYSDYLVPGGNALELIGEINDERPQRVLLVGHEPDLSSLISVLVTGGSDAGIELKKGGLCRLTTEKLVFGKCATLNWLLTPKQLRELR
jgi:phosphohistidine phosphatase